MPLYVYDCLGCKKKLNIRHSYKDKNIKCTECGSENLKKNLSNVLQVTRKCYNNKEETGSQVKKAIKDGKKDLEIYKNKQQKRIYRKK